MIRLMIVEDSVTTRDMLIYSLAAERDIEVVGVAEDGEEAVNIVTQAKPDIILMDINMPRLNGYEASIKIMQTYPTPILLMTATWDINEVKKIVESMHIGVLGIHEKPYGPGHPKYKELYEKIVADIRVMSEVKVVRKWDNDFHEHAGDFKKIQKTECRIVCSLVLIGSSTGGPPVIHTILKSLGADYPLPILIAQHMSSEFIDSFIEWLDSECALKIKKAQDGEKISAGFVYIAPSGYHLTVQNHTIRLLKSDTNDLYVPSVSKLFASAIRLHAAETIAILLSGMGNDGAEEITQLKHGGAVTIGQNEATSVVFGMAKEAIKKDGIQFVLSPQGIVELLLEMKITHGELL